MIFGFDFSKLGFKHQISKLCLLELTVYFISGFKIINRSMNNPYPPIGIAGNMTILVAKPILPILFKYQHKANHRHRPRTIRSHVPFFEDEPLIASEIIITNDTRIPIALIPNPI